MLSDSNSTTDFGAEPIIYPKESKINIDARKKVKVDKHINLQIKRILPAPLGILDGADDELAEFVPVARRPVMISYNKP